ncbi:unnamed protein product [Arctia plantaginis]|uniref:Choline O-acetyltransferase n=1 Tax=Arctia plantaginis TaxID=874455 RepID=A0A8S0ZPK5_ARCPL|nr:unnamed protein product [Arctia plantaginis]
MKLSQTQALVQLRTSLASSDNPLLAKILQSIDAATSDEHLFEVTLKLLKSLCVCMRDTLKAKEDTYNSAKNLIGLSKTVSTEGKVLDLYKKIYNNTCFNLKHDLSKHSNTSSESWSHANCGKEDRQKENNTPKNEEDSVKNVLKSKLDHILYRALVQTRHHHKYNIKKYNLFGKAKSKVRSSLIHTLIVILTLHPEYKDLRKYNVVEEDLHKVLHKNSTIDIDIIDTKYDQKGKESEEAVKPEVYSDCHLQSLYTYLAESEKKNLTKVFRYLRRRDTIKIYIEVFTGRNHSDYINICCTNGSITASCKKELIEYIDSQENITVQYKKLDKEKSMALKNSFKNTISKLKQLVKRLDYKSFNNSTIDLNISNIDISNNITNTNTMKNGVLSMKESNSITDQLGLKPNGVPNFAENLTHPLKLRDVSRAIILLNDFVSKQTTTDNIKSPGTNQTDYTQVDLINTLALTEVPFTESNLITFKELSPTTISNLANFEENATKSEKKIETIQNMIHMITVDKQDGIDFNKNVALQLNDTESASLANSFKTKSHIVTTSAIPHERVTNKHHPFDVVFTDLDNKITTHGINTKMVSTNDKNKPNKIFKNNLQHKLSSYKTLKDIFPKYSTKSYDTNLTKMRPTKHFPPGSNRPHIQHVSKNDNNILNKNQDKVTRENEKATTAFKFEKNNLQVTGNISKYMNLLQLKVRNDTIPKPFTISISKHPENVINVYFPHVQKESKQDTLTTQHEDGNLTKSNKQYYLEHSTKSKAFQKNIVNSQIAVTAYSNGNISTINFGTKNTKNWRIKKNRTTTASKWSNIIHSYSKTTHIDKLRPKPFTSMQTSALHHKQKLQSQNATNYLKTLSKHDKLKNDSASTKYSFMSTTKSVKTFLTPNNIFKFKADNTFPERPIKIPIKQDSLLGDSMLAKGIHTKRITLVPNQRTMPLMKSKSMPTRSIASDKNGYYKYKSVTTKMAPILNAIATAGFDKTSRIKTISFKPKTIIPNMEWNSQSVMTVPHFDRTKTSEESSTSSPKDKNTVLNLSNMINNRDVDIETSPSTTTHNNNPLDNRNIKINGQTSSQKISFNNQEIELNANYSAVLHTTKFYGLQNTYNHVASSVPVTTHKAVSSTKSSTANIDADEMVTNKNKVKETLTTSTIGLTEVTNMSGLKSYTINYGDRDPIENTINFIETFEDQIELNIPNDKNNTIENYNPKNIVSNTGAVILTRTTNNYNYSTELSNETERDKNSIDNTENSTDKQAVRNSSVINSIKKSTKPIKYTLPNTKNVIYQEPLMFTETTLSSTSPMSYKFNQSSTTTLKKTENNISDLKNSVQDIVKNINVIQKHITETSGSTEKYSLLKTKAAISEEIYDEMENSIFDTTAKKISNLEKTINIEINPNPISDQNDEEEFLTKSLFAENDENNSNTTIEPQTQQNNFIKAFENVGKNTAPEIKETMLKQPCDFNLTENVVSQTTTETISKTNTIENIINRSKLIVLPTNPTFPTFPKQNIPPISKGTLTYSQNNINDIMFSKSYNAISEPINVLLSSTMCSTNKNYESSAINIDNVIKGTNELTETGNTKQTLETITQNTPFKKPYNFLDTENTKFNNIPDSLYDELFATKTSNSTKTRIQTSTVEIINASNNIVSKTKIADLTTTPTISQQNIKKTSNNTLKYNSKKIKDTIFTESYKATLEPRNVNITNATRNTTKHYENDVSTTRYIDHVTKITSSRNKTTQSFEVITKTRSNIEPYKLLGTEHTEFDKTSETIYDEMFDTSMKNKKDSTSTTWNTTKNFKYEINNITNIVLVMEKPINSTEIHHNTIRTLESITKNTPFTKPDDLLGTRNIILDNTSDLTMNKQNQRKDIMKAIESIENRSKINTNVIIPLINIKITSYNKTLKYTPKNIRNTMFTESYKGILDPDPNIKKSSTVWNTTKKYESNINSIAGINVETQMKDTSTQITRIPNKGIQKIKAFIKYTSPTTKNLTHTQLCNFSGTVNTIFSDKTDELNSKNIEGTTIAIGSIVNKGKITTNSIFLQRNVKETYNTLKDNSNDIEGKMFTESYNALLEPEDVNTSTTKKYENGEINAGHIDDETIMKSMKTTKTQNNATRKLESVVKYTSPITGSTTDVYIFHDTPDPIRNEMFGTKSNNKEDILNAVKINKSINDIRVLTTNHVLPQSNMKNTFKYDSMNENNKMFTESYNAVLESKTDHIFATKKYGNDVINVGNIGDKTKIKDKSINTTKTQKFASTIKYTSPMTRSTTDEYTLHNTPDPVYNEMFRTNSNNKEDIINAVKINKSINEIKYLTSHHVFSQSNINSSFKYDAIIENNKMVTESYNAILESKTDHISTTKKYGNDVINFGNIGDKTKIKDKSINTTKTQNFQSTIKYTSPMTRSTTDEYIFYDTPDSIHSESFGTNTNNKEYIINAVKINESRNEIKDLTTNHVLPQSNMKSTFKYDSMNENNKMFTESYNVILESKTDHIFATKKYGNDVINISNIGDKTKIKDKSINTTKTQNFQSTIKYTSPMTRSTTDEYIFYDTPDSIHSENFGTNYLTNKDIVSKSNNNKKESTTNLIFPQSKIKVTSYSSFKYNLKNIKDKMITESYAISKLKNDNNSGTTQKTTKIYENNTINIGNINIQTKIKDTLVKMTKAQKFERVLKYTSPITRSTTYKSILFHTSPDSRHYKVLETNLNNTEDIIKDNEMNKSSNKIKGLFTARNTKAASHSILKYNSTNIKDEMFTKSYNAISEPRNVNKSSKIWHTTKKYENSAISTENIHNKAKMNEMSMKTTETQDNATQKFKSDLKYTLEEEARNTNYKYILHNIPDPIHYKVFKTNTTNTKDFIKTIKKRKIRDFTTNPIFPKINVKATSYNTFKYRPNNTKGFGKETLISDRYKNVTIHTNVEESSTIEKTSKKYEYDDNNIEAIDKLYNITVALSNTALPKTNTIKPRENIIKYKLATVNTTNFKELDNLLASQNTKLYNTTEPMNNKLFSTNSKNTKVLTNVTENIVSTNKPTNLTTNPIFLQRNIEATLNSPVKYSFKHKKGIIFTESYNAISKPMNVKIPSTIWHTPKSYENDVINVSNIDHVTKVTDISKNAARTRNYSKQKLETVTSRPFETLHKFLATKNTQPKRTLEPIHTEMYVKHITRIKESQDMQKNISILMLKQAGTRSPLFTKKLSNNLYKNKDIINNTLNTNNRTFKLKYQRPTTKFNVTENNVDINKIQNMTTNSIFLQKNLIKTADSTVNYIPMDNKEPLFNKPTDLEGTESTVFETALITTEEFWSNPDTTKKSEKKDPNIISDQATLQNNIFKVFNTVPYTATNIEDTTVAKLYNFKDNQNDTLNTTLKINVKASLARLNNIEIYNKNAEVTKDINKTQDTKINSITVQNKVEYIPRSILKYTNNADSIVFIAPYNSKQIKTINMDPTYEGTNKEKQSKIAGLKTTNPIENITDISKIQNKFINPTDAYKNIAIPFQSTTAASCINTTFEKPIINTEYLLQPYNIKNIIDVNKIKDRQQITTAILGSSIKFAQPNIQFTIFKKLYNKTDNSIVNSKIEATTAKEYQPTTNLNIVNAINNSRISTNNVLSEESSNFRVTETILDNVLIPTNYKKSLVKPNITKNNLNYTAKFENVSKASNVINSIFLQNIITTAASTTKYTQTILNEKLLTVTESTIFMTEPELKNNVTSKIKTFNNNLTTIGHKPILNNIASESHKSWKNVTSKRTQSIFHNLKALTKAMSVKYFTSKPHTFVHTALKIKNKSNKGITIKKNDSSYLKTFWPLDATEPILPVLPTNLATDLLKINTTGLQEQHKQPKKMNTLVTQINHKTVENSKMNLKELQFSRENTKELMLSKQTPKNQELHLQVLSKPFDFNTDATLKLDLHPSSPSSTSHVLKHITTPTVGKIQMMNTKKLVTAATPYTVSVTAQSYQEILRPILGQKATNNRTHHQTDKSLVFNNFLYTKPIQKHDVPNKFVSNVTQSKSHKANGTLATINKTSSVISESTKLEISKTFTEPTKIPIYKYNSLNPMIFPIINGTRHSKSSNLKTITPDEIELSIRVGIETTKDRIQFTLVSIDEKPKTVSHRVEPKSAKKSSTKAFVLPLNVDLNGNLNSKGLTLMNLTRRANERKEIEKAITLSNNIKQINLPETTISIEKKPVTVITNSQNRWISNITVGNISTIDGGNKTSLYSKQIIELVNISSTVQPTWKQHKKIVIKPASLTDQFIMENLKHMYQEHLQKLKKNNNITDKIKIKTQMYVTNKNEEEDSDSLFRENDNSEDDNSMFVPHHVPKTKMSFFNNVTKEHNATYSTTHILLSHDNVTNSYQHLTETNKPTYFQDKQNKIPIIFEIKDVKLQNNSKFNIKDYSKTKFINDTTTYSTDIKEKLHNGTVYITPNQNKIIGKTNMSITEISNISVGEPSAIETKQRKKSLTRKRKKLINALKYKTDITDLLKKLVKTKEIDIKKLNTTNKNDIIHRLLSKIRKPTIHINKSYIQNKSTNILIKTNYKKKTDEKLHEEYKTQIDKPTRKSYFNHANDTQTIHNYQIPKPTDKITKKENGKKMSLNRSFAMISTIYLTEVTKKPESKKSNPHSFSGMKLDENSGVQNSTKSYKVFNLSLNNNLQKNPAATFSEIEIKDKITKPVTSKPITLNIIPSNTTDVLSFINNEIKDQTDFTKNNSILDDDNKSNLKWTTLTTTNIKASNKTHFITIKISIPYLTVHATTKMTNDQLEKLPTNINAKKFTPKPKTITAMFNYQSKDSIDPLTPAVFITNATQTSINSKVQPKTFRDISGISHSLEILSGFTSNDRKTDIDYVHKMGSAPNKAITTTSNLTLNDFLVRRHVNEQNKSVTESSKQVLNDINLNLANKSISKYDIYNKFTEVYSAISNANNYSKTSKPLILLNLSDNKELASNTEYISKYGTNLNITKQPQKYFFNAVSNEIPPGNKSDLSRTKKIMYTTNDEIMPGETQKKSNLFLKMIENYNDKPDASITPTIVTKVLNLKQNDLKLANNSILEIRTIAQLYNKTSSNTLDFKSTYGLNYTTSPIHTNALKEFEKDQQHNKKFNFTSSTVSENYLKPTVATYNPTIFNKKNNIYAYPITTTVRFKTTDNNSHSIITLLSNHQSSSMYTTKRTSNKPKKNDPTPKSSLNTTPYVLSTIGINLNQTTSLVKNLHTTRHVKLNTFETKYRDGSSLPQDLKENIMTMSSLSANTTSMTNQADFKNIYNEVTQNPNETQVDTMTAVGKLYTNNTEYIQTEIMPSLLKIKNTTISERETKVITNFVKSSVNLLIEHKTPNREKSNFGNPQNTTQIISTNAKDESNHTSHLIAMPFNTVSKIYILDPKSSKSIWSRYTRGNKKQNTKTTTKIYQNSYKISKSFTNINPLSKSYSIDKQSKNFADMTITVASHKSEMNISYNKEIQKNETQLLTDMTVPFVLNNSIHQKQAPNQLKMRNLQNKISHKVTNISLDTTRNSSKYKMSGLPNFVTVKYKDKNTKYTSKDRFLPISYKSNNESIPISNRKIKYNPLSTIFAESASIEGKNVKIYSSRLNRYHFLRPPLTVTNHIKYNTYQPPTEEDNESPTLKPKISPRPNISCAILKTMRHKFHSTYEFIEFLKASNCSADNLTIHFNIKNNRFSRPPSKQNPNRKTSNIKHPAIKLTKKVFTKYGSKESLLNSFEKTKLYPVKPAKAVLPKLPPNIVKRINIGGPKKKEIMSMNTRDFFSQHRLATPSHLKNQKVRQNNPLFVNTRYSILRPKFHPLEVPRHKIDRPKTFFMPPRNEEETFAEIFEAPLHHKKLNWKQQIGSVRAALQNNPGALFPTQIKASVSNVLDKPHTHPKTDWDLFRDKTDLSKKKLWGPPDFVPLTWPPTYDLSLPKPLTPTGDEYNLRQLQYRRNFQVVTPTPKDWWLNDMYLKVRLPLPINSNPGMVFPRRHFAKMEEVADLGALFIDDILDYKEMLDRGELPLERATSREKGQPLCMEQFYRLLGVCRIPEVGKDRLELPAVKSGKEEQEELVVVACRNYFYPIPVKAVDRGRITPGEIQAQLLHAMVDAAGAPPAPRIGLLTSMNRDQWARAREHLIKDEMNRMNLELISRALCILCLDEAGGDRADTDPETNAMLRAMHGAGTRHHSANRWFDKTVQLIISSDGTVGMCYEHSSAEGVAVVRLAERALARAEVADRPAPPPALLPAPQAMKWNIVPDVQRTIEHAARELDRAISDLDFKVYTYRGYGREFMKSCRTSPDVYIQLAIQYAYYKMYGYLVTTYESASLRRFRQGRVDNIRSAHGAALAWAAAMCTADASPLNDGTDEGQKKVSFNLYGEQKKIELFEEAARKQTSIMEANILGKGIDNHLLGLREMARETLGELPPVFCDTAYKQMFEFKMSTSQVTTTTDGTFMGYGAVCPDGYGCCYNPKKDSIIFCIASFTSSPVTNTEAYRQSLEEALDSMKLMFQARKAEN